MRSRRPQGGTSEESDVVIDLTEQTEHTDSICWLFRAEDGTPFAFGRGSDFIRISDHALWASFRDDGLFSARSGECLATLRGRVFFDADTDEPAFYVPVSCALPPSRSGELTARSS